MLRRMHVQSFGAFFTVTVVPTLQDNYSYVIHDTATGTLAAVDVNADTAPVLRCLHDLGALSPTAATAAVTPTTAANTQLRYILTTHKHWDHAGGNVALATQLREKHGGTHDVEVVCGANDRVAGATRLCSDGDVVDVGELRVTVHDVPCHTRGHVMYTVQHPRHRDAGMAVFTGDTVFVAGLGAFFEGGAADMVRAMTRLYHINDNNSNNSSSSSGRTPTGCTDASTFIFPGHEYTLNFVTFAERMLRERGAHDEAARVAAQLQQYKSDVQAGRPTVPSTLSQEKLHNLFLRVVDGAFRQRMGYHTGNDADDAEKLMMYLYNACD